jgi:hypothetical protein
LLLAVIAAVVLTLSAIGRALAGNRAPAATGPGTLTICMAGDNGTVGSPFSFALTNLTTGATQSVAVTGGSCSGAMGVDPGKWLIQEDLSSKLWVMSGVVTDPEANLLTEKDPLGQAKVNVFSGAPVQVTITNTESLATLKVCDWSRTPALQGSQFSFTVGTYGTVTAVAGTTAAGAGCSGIVNLQPGSRIQVTESLPAQENVADVRVGGSASLTGWKGPVAKLTVGVGVNTITFEDEPVAPPQNGWLEICKAAGDPYVSGTFSFTVTDRIGVTTPVDVLVGQCSGPIQVPAGNVTVAEAPTPNVRVSDIEASPASDLGLTNLTNGTATIVVPVMADPTGEVLVSYTNSAITGTLKVCKVLTASSTVLAGSTFTFDITSANGASTATIVASASANGACKVIPGVVPVGSTVTVTEEGMPWVGADGNDPGTGDTKTVTITPGTNTVSFTNQAYGQLDLCKNMQTGDEAYNGTLFTFTVTGVASPVQFAAGQCSLPQVIPAGSVKMTETSIPTGFAFVSSTATGPMGENRATSGTAADGGNPITVALPWFGDPSGGGDTTVTVVNRVLRAQLKVCTVIAPGSTGSLAGTTFSYTISVNGNQVQTVTSASPYPSCTGLLLSVPIVKPGGGKATIKVKPVVPGGATYAPTGFSIDNYSGTPSIQLSSPYYISYTPAVGNAAVTVTWG